MIVTEARQSIRESLRIFNKMQCFLNARISLHFEDIINHQYKLLNNDSSINLNYHYHKHHDKSSNENVKNHRSCGNSMNCFVSLFLSLFHSERIFDQIQELKMNILLHSREQS